MIFMIFLFFWCATSIPIAHYVVCMQCTNLHVHQKKNISAHKISDNIVLSYLS